MHKIDFRMSALEGAIVQVDSKLDQIIARLPEHTSKVATGYATDMTVHDIEVRVGRMEMLLVRASIRDSDFLVNKGSTHAPGVEKYSSSCQCEQPEKEISPSKVIHETIIREPLTPVRLSLASESIETPERVCGTDSLHCRTQYHHDQDPVGQSGPQALHSHDPMGQSRPQALNSRDPIGQPRPLSENNELSNGEASLDDIRRLLFDSGQQLRRDIRGDLNVKESCAA